jgi:hydrogenase expression/formation protein HypE
MSNTILLGHGSGGRMMHELIATHFAPAFGIRGVSDAAVLDIPEGARMAVTTDSYVVSPLFFPGGNIGDLAVNGTINDLAVSGARPLYLTAGFIIEEGFHFADLEKIVGTMATAAQVAGVRIVAGDTKVVDKGKGDGMFINTAGIGIVPKGIELSAGNMRPGDRILLSGSIGRHGVAVMAERNGLDFSPPVQSDTAALHVLTAEIIASATEQEGSAAVRVMRDPTRGGLATTLKEFASESGLCIELEESAVPVEPGVRGACDLLGLDPLYVANEGILVAVLDGAVAEYVRERLCEHSMGTGAVLIGNVARGPEGMVLLHTSVGGKRIVDMLPGEQLPRIC